jgi:hypothetical protein
MLLVLPIDDNPVPLVNGTHRKWRKLVKDLSVPRRFIMQKLAISMLNVGDELHTEVCSFPLIKYCIHIALLLLLTLFICLIGHN